MHAEPLPDLLPAQKFHPLLAMFQQSSGDVYPSIALTCCTIWCCAPAGQHYLMHYGLLNNEGQHVAV
jgi:hypothetical protein